VVSFNGAAGIVAPARIPPPADPSVPTQAAYAVTPQVTLLATASRVSGTVTRPAEVARCQAMSLGLVRYVMVSVARNRPYASHSHRSAPRPSAVRCLRRNAVPRT